MQSTKYKTWWIETYYSITVWHVFKPAYIFVPIQHLSVYIIPWNVLVWYLVSDGTGITDIITTTGTISLSVYLA